MKKILFLVLVTMLNVSSAQKSTDDESIDIKNIDFDALEKKILEYRSHRDFIKAQLYASIFLEKGKKESDTSKITRGYFLMANTSYGDSVHIYADSVIKFSKDKPDFLYPASAYLLKGNSFAIDGNYKEAFNQIANANTYAINSNNEAQQFEIKYLLSRLYTKIGDYETSLKTIEEILPEYEDCKDCIRGYIILSWAYVHNLNFLGKVDKAESIYKKVFPLSLKTPDSLIYNKFLLASAITKYHKKDYNSSLDSINKLEQLNKNYDNVSSKVLKYLYKGKIYFTQNKDSLAILNLKKVDSLSLASNYIHPSIRENYELLIDYYKGTNDIKSQLLYVDKLLKTDSILDSDFSFLTKNINAKYTTPNLLLEKQRIIDSLKRDKTSKTTSISALILCLLLVTSLLIWNTKKRNVYKKRIEELVTKKKRQSHIINDETTKRILDKLLEIEASQLFLKEDFSLNFLADKLDTNTSYLSKIINEHKKLSFKQYLIDLRIKFLIKQLDENPIMQKYSIEALAKSVGYTNASSFTRIFKSYLGESPSSFFNRTYPERIN